jgi:predicted TIM-barrel fold metal-dependent hydrolase
MTIDNMQVIAIEEHYWDHAVTDHWESSAAGRRGPVQERLYDYGKLRIKEMDEAGVDIQVLSHGAPSTQRLPADSAAEITKQANDNLKAIIDAHPDRFGGFAALPTADPKAAADELERAVDKLGLCGAMIHGMSNGEFVDLPKYWPIYERAQALDVPIYLHPGRPHPAVQEVYYKDYAEKYPNFVTSGWGYTVETATQGIRMVLSGVFEKYPDLKIVLGHLGESLPFSLWRIDQSLSRVENEGGLGFRDTFAQHFWITTSGNFSDPSLLCCIQEMGMDRIIFSIDYPFVDNPPGTEWMERLHLNRQAKEKILNGNVKALLKMD